MVFEIGVNLRVTECLDKGDRCYMEDFSKCYFERVDGSIVFGFFGIFDGHGGSEAANFAKKTLIVEIKKIPLFWSESDDEVLNSIKQGFLNTHKLMWAERDRWSKTISGFSSTAGTTATIAIVRNRKLYIGHVGDSACVIGYSSVLCSRTDEWEAKCLTVDHKPSNVLERNRIEKCGGALAKKSGIERVVWRRPKLNITNQDALSGDSSLFEDVPFLAVTRSLGDLWSYDAVQGVYHISPEPDLQCLSLDSTEHRCLIIGSDGLWNVVSTKAAIEIIRICERETERRVFLDPNVNSNFFYNPAASLVKYAITQWKRRHIRADNVSALVVMIDPPGPSMTKRREDRRLVNFTELHVQRLLDSKSGTYEGFSKMLSKEFLIECSKWRSANDAKDDAIDLKADLLSIKMSKNKDDHFSKHLHRNSSEGALLMPSISNDFKTTTNSNAEQLENIFQNAITSDSFYGIYCDNWINKTKIWDFLHCYFKAKGITTEFQVIEFLNSIDPHICSEILKIIPWIYNAKKLYKENNQLHVSLSVIPIFSDFWLDLYMKVIKPYRRSSNGNSTLHIHAILEVLKPNIIDMLKNYNYMINQRIADKAMKQHILDNNNKNNAEMPALCKYVNDFTIKLALKKQNMKSLSICDMIFPNLQRHMKICKKSNSQKLATNKINWKTKLFPLTKFTGDEKLVEKSLITESRQLTDMYIASRLSGMNYNYRHRRVSSLINGLNCNNVWKVSPLKVKRLCSKVNSKEKVHSKGQINNNPCIDSKISTFNSFQG